MNKEESYQYMQNTCSGPGTASTMVVVGQLVLWW